MSKYIVINGKNGWSALGPQNLYDKIREFHGKGARFYVVAVGEDNQWALVTSEGSSWSANRSNGFDDKMHSIQCSDVKSISFGPQGTWAIVMKSGFCHASCFSGNDGPLDTINEHQNSIKYVGMTANKGEWIIGYGKNGFTYHDVAAELISYLQGVKTAGNILDVELGRSQNKWFVESDRNTRWKYDEDSDFHAKAKGDGARLWSMW